MGTPSIPTADHRLFDTFLTDSRSTFDASLLLPLLHLWRSGRRRSVPWGRSSGIDRPAGHCGPAIWTEIDSGCCTAL